MPGESSNDCAQADIIAAIVPDGFIGDLDNFVFDCVRFDDDFVHGGAHLTRLEQATIYFGEYRIYGIEFVVSNGIDFRANQLQSFDTRTPPEVEQSHRVE